MWVGLGGEGNTVFWTKRREAKPWPCPRASVRRQAARWDQFLILAGLGLAGPRYLCVAFICIGLSKQLVLNRACGAVTPRCPRVMIPRAGDVCQPQTSACGDFVEPGTPQAPDAHVGQFPESGTCPRTRCPQVLIPSLRDTSQPPTSARRSLAPRLSRTSRYPCVVTPRARNVCEPPPDTYSRGKPQRWGHLPAQAARGG